MIELIQHLQTELQLETVEEKRKRNKEKRLEIKRLKKEAYDRNQIEINETKSILIDKIKTLESKLKYNKFKNLKENIEYEIAVINVKLTKLDENFIKRNMIRLKLCPKTAKGKECKYEECTYAHSINDIRKPKCINYMFNICKFGKLCIHDHTKSELPEIPVKKEEVLVEDPTLVLNNVDNGYKYVTIVNNICIYTNKNSTELQKLKNCLNSIQN
jgi:hypothetical protein